MKEIWKEINDFDGIYFISNLGNVKSVERIVYYPESCYNKTNKGVTRKEKLLKPSYKKRYLSVTLSKDNNKFYYLIHRLVAIHFIDNPNNLPCVNHIDGNKHNNIYTNLEWTTHSENSIHAIKNGLTKFKTGKDNHNYKHGKYLRNKGV